MNNSTINKIILITGCSSGFGMLTAARLAAGGHTIYATMRNLHKQDTLKQELAKRETKCQILYLDVTDDISINKVIKTIEKQAGRLDVLINNAGITMPLMKNKLFYEKENWAKTIDVNLTASFFSSQEAIKYMIKRKEGSIINITSLNAELAFPKNPSYVASKGGLKMVGKALAKDWGKFGVRVNNLGPGYIKTSMTKSSYSNRRTRLEREKQTLLQRWGNMDDLVGPCIFLASDASKYITGQDIYVDGGWTAGYIRDF